MKIVLLAVFLIGGHFARADFEKTFSEKLIQGIQADLSKRMSLPKESFQVGFSKLRVQPQAMKKVRESKLHSIEVLGLDMATARRFSGLTSFPVLAKTSVGTFEYKVKGLLNVIGPVFVSRVPMARNHIVKQEDLQVTMMPWKKLATGVATLRSERIVGKRLSRFVQAGSAIMPNFIEAPYMVNTGDMVDLVVMSGPGVMIRSRAVAKKAGHFGDTIDLVQPETKKKLKAVVVGDKRVEVKL